MFLLHFSLAHREKTKGYKANLKLIKLVLTAFIDSFAQFCFISRDKTIL